MENTLLVDVHCSEGDDIEETVATKESSSLISASNPRNPSGERDNGSLTVPQGSNSFFSIIRHSWFMKESILLMKLAIPLFLTLVAQQMLFIMSLVYMGHLTGSALEMDGTALGVSFINITGVSFVSGLATAADTLCSQSYGSKNYKRVGVILQRGILIVGLGCLPVAVIWLNCEPLLLLARQQPCVVRLTTLYVKTSVFILPALVVFTMLERYLQAQSIVWTFVVVNLLLFAISAALHPLLIYVADLGTVGAALSNVLAYTIMTASMIVYIWCRGLHKKTWGGWSWQSLDEWGQFLKYGVPGLLIMCFEWWSFEIGFLVTGSIDKTQLGVHSIFSALEYNTYMVPFCIGLAACIRVGNELGAGNPQGARRVANTAYILGGFLALAILVFFLLTKDFIPRLFITDQDVIENAKTAIYGLVLVTTFDGIQAMGAGILRGSGRQNVGAAVSICSYYVIGLPIGISLALFADMGAFGLWIGLGIANGIQSLLYMFFLLKTNWKRQAEKAIKNAKASRVEDHIQHKKKDVSLDPIIKMNGFHGDTNELRNDDVIPLMSLQESESGELQNITEESLTIKVVAKTSRTRLLLVKGSFFVAGLALLIVGVILAVVFQEDSEELDKICKNDSCIDSACNYSTTGTLFTKHNTTLF